MFLFFVELALAIAAGIIIVPIFLGLVGSLLLAIGAIIATVSEWAEELGKGADKVIGSLYRLVSRTVFHRPAQ